MNNTRRHWRAKLADVMDPFTLKEALHRATMPFEYVHSAESRWLEREEEADKLWRKRVQMRNRSKIKLKRCACICAVVGCLVKVEVFYSTRCPHCRVARSVVRRVVKRFRKRLEKRFGRRFERRFGWSLEVEEVNTLTRSGAVRAEEYGIRAVPTIVVNGNGKKKIVGVPREKKLRELIEKEMEID